MYKLRKCHNFCNMISLIAMFLAITSKCFGQESEEVELFDEECQAPPVQLLCQEPRTRYWSYGLASNFPLFTDASMEIKCEEDGTPNILKSVSTVKKYRPFSGLFKCEENEIITGLEVCFQADIKYIAPFCTPLEKGFILKTDEIVGTSNTPEEPDQATCPDKMAMITLKLESDDDGNVIVFISCAEIVKEVE